MNKQLKSLLQFAVFLAIGVGILWMIYDNINASYMEECALKGVPEQECSLIQKLLADFASVRWFWLFLVLLTFMISNFSRAHRWQMLLEPLGYKAGFGNCFFSIMLGYFANLGLPRMGEFVRAGALSRNENIPFEKSMGTIVTDRIFDFIMLGIMLMLGFLLNFPAIWKFIENSPVMGWMGEYGYVLVIVGAVGLTLLVFFIQWMRKTSTDPQGFLGKVKSIARGFGQGVMSIRRVKNIPLFLFHSVFIWAMYYAMTYLCFFAYEPTSHLPPEAGLIVFDLGAIGMVVPSPGGMGSYHYMLIQGLQLFGIDKISGFAFANILFFSIQIFCNVFFGIIALIWLPYVRRKKITG